MEPWISVIVSLISGSLVTVIANAIINLRKSSTDNDILIRSTAFIQMRELVERYKTEVEARDKKLEHMQAEIDRLKEENTECMVRHKALEIKLEALMSRLDGHGDYHV